MKFWSPANYDLVFDMESAKKIIDGSANSGPAGHRAICLQGAIWPYPGKVDAEATGEDHWTNKVKLSADGGKSGATGAIAMPALIEMCGGSVDLLKLDGEGSEPEIFALNSASWLPAIRNVLIDLHSQDCSESFFGALSQDNYEMTNQGMVYFCRNIRPNAAARFYSAPA
jgi:hypothetical protein